MSTLKWLKHKTPQRNICGRRREICIRGHYFLQRGSYWNYKELLWQKGKNNPQLYSSSQGHSTHLKINHRHITGTTPGNRMSPNIWAQLGVAGTFWPKRRAESLWKCTIAVMQLLKHFSLCSLSECPRLITRYQKDRFEEPSTADGSRAEQLVRWKWGHHGQGSQLFWAPPAMG